MAQRRLVGLEAIGGAPIIDRENFFRQALGDALGARAEHEARALRHPEIGQRIPADAVLLAPTPRNSRGRGRPGARAGGGPTRSLGVSPRRGPALALRRSGSE